MRAKGGREGGREGEREGGRAGGRKGGQGREREAEGRERAETPQKGQ